MDSIEAQLKLPEARLDQDPLSPQGVATKRASVTGVEKFDRQADIESHVIRLFEKISPALIKYGLAICQDLALAEDAVQEAFLRYYVALRKGTARMDSKGWLYSTTRNYILDRLKEYQYRNGKSLEAASQVAEKDENPESGIMLREIHSAAQGLLSPRESECLQLRNEGLRYRDIAEILKIDSATVGVLLGRAMKKIRTALNQKEGER